MSSVESQLLDALASGVRPFDTAPSTIPKVGAGFDALLSGAMHGQGRSDLGIRFAPSASGIYDQTEQAKIAQGVDRAAQAGVDHALILHDQRTLRVDVRNRVVLEVSDLDEELVVNKIDGFVSLNKAQSSPESDENGEIVGDPGLLGAPARGVRNASLVHALAGRVPD